MDNDQAPRLADALVNAGLLAASIALGLLSFFASLDLVLVIGAQVIIHTNDSAVRSRYALATARNVWLVVGGIIWLVAIIASIDYFFKHWRVRRRRLYLVILGIELAIIAARTAIFS